MEDKTKIPLTAAEMSTLWMQYLNDSLAECVSKYFVQTVEDPEIKPIVDKLLHTSGSHLDTIKQIFEKDQFPVPVGFSDEDVNPKAPRLFSDIFITRYYRQMSILAMASSSAALGLVTRPDIVEFHKKVLEESVMVQDLLRGVMLKQGTYIKPPYISVPEKVDFVEKQSFLTGFFGDKRVVTAPEITHLYVNIQTNSIGKALMVGFAQTVKDSEVKDYLVRGAKIAQKHVDTFSHFLQKDNLSAPMTWDSAITSSTEAVFSEKLIMFHVSGMVAAGIGNYGMAMAASPRRDLGVKYASLLPEITAYAEDGAKLMVKNGWLEEPPQADDRKKLIGK